MIAPENLCGAFYSKPQNMENQMADYEAMTVTALRTLAREKGWTGADVVKASKKQLVAFHTTGKKPDEAEPGPLTCAVNDSNLTITNGPDTITAPLDEWRQALLKVGAIPETVISENNPAVPETPIPETIRTFQQQTGRRSGRPAAQIPENLTPLLKIFQECSAQGRPLYRTGKQGVFARRDELPEPFRQIGRDRLEHKLSELLHNGTLEQSPEGWLAVPNIKGGFQE